MIMWANAKAAALHGLYHDVAVKCAHPTLLWQVLVSKGLKYGQCKLCLHVKHSIAKRSFPTNPRPPKNGRIGV
jgi:hypothetical protein